MRYRTARKGEWDVGKRRMGCSGEVMGTGERETVCLVEEWGAGEREKMGQGWGLTAVSWSV